MPIDRFFSINRNQYASFREVDDFIKVYNWLSEIDQLSAMIKASDERRPALEGVVEELNVRFEDNSTFPLHHKTNRQAVGAAIKEILFDFGYIQLDDKVKLSKKLAAYPFKSATQYVYAKEFATKKLQTKLEIKPISQKPPKRLEELSSAEIKEYAQKAYDKKYSRYVRNDEGYIIITMKDEYFNNIKDKNNSLLGSDKVEN